MLCINPIGTPYICNILNIINYVTRWSRRIVNFDNILVMIIIISRYHIVLRVCGMYSYVSLGQCTINSSIRNTLLPKTTNSLKFCLLGILFYIIFGHHSSLSARPLTSAFLPHVPRTMIIDVVVRHESLILEVYTFNSWFFFVAARRPTQLWIRLIISI